ncbi:hypothetical protein FZI85_02740 [Mycobacterium sp. CBMA293]|uniref:hypothetical protein n=1 Tax=unclassified Mycolicibacterium TaxID=2636767 RepID=UPI0012DF381E|nr:MULTISPECIES: hypothetical protein [unclassified Mycolicibacterium]MUL48048.1 hypothetical protein [Mycolicibacterium sp. CBMA 360]MUL58226.1 hypothetical protein [Mycolicibacterium sp. CBMA 335]MUL73684.1 hypothetical protein [Mycolicibacterium sp. CBMA 311]MUL93109.1 hypothetical protein [Mycolicibacterium sp. CBMA 230]MUM07658.1 hypothetical protein [Mycolicibacterium sp. CBMA 213]
MKFNRATNFKRAVTASTLAAGIGVTGLFGIGLAGASADPGQCPPNVPCGQHDDHHDNRGPDGRDQGRDQGPGQAPGRDDNWHDNQGRDWQHRGIDDARGDHQPFNYNGQWVNPVWDGGHNAWGFWLGPIWIPL